MARQSGVLKSGKSMGIRVLLKINNQVAISWKKRTSSFLQKGVVTYIGGLMPSLAEVHIHAIGKPAWFESQRYPHVGFRSIHRLPAYRTFVGNVVSQLF